MPKGHPKSGRLAPKKGQAYGGVGKCSYESVEGIGCSRSGPYSLRFAMGGYCHDHALELMVERSKEPSRQVRRVESDRYSAEFGLGRAPEYA